MNREEMLSRVKRRAKPWDMVVIGGGAVGAVVALDTSARGLEALLSETLHPKLPYISAEVALAPAKPAVGGLA